jgi:tripartite-type tricarboxylate transporter receptor subunit TctC
VKHDIPSPPLGGEGQGEVAGKFMIHNWLYRTTALLLAATAVTLAHAQTSPSGSTQGYPAKPVRMLVAFPAGGSADIVARVIAQRLSEQVGQNFIVDNRPGAGGNLAFEALSRADADGYTILNSTPGIVINPHLYRKVAFKLEDFVAVARIGEAPLLVMANPSVPANTIGELIQLARTKPGSVRYASAGNGSSSHLASEVMRMMAGVDLLHVPYKGGGPAFQDVMGGRVEFTTLPIAESLANVQAKRVKALAQTGLTRSQMAPEVPTLDESGLKGYSVTTWYVVFAPVKTPKDLVARLYADIDKVLRHRETQEKLASSGVTIINGNPDEAARFIRSENEKWAKLIEKSGAKLD